jgi:hypothetical protein
MTIKANDNTSVMLKNLAATLTGGATPSPAFAKNWNNSAVGNNIGMTNIEEHHEEESKFPIHEEHEDDDEEEGGF